MTSEGNAERRGSQRGSPSPSKIGLVTSLVGLALVGFDLGACSSSISSGFNANGGGADAAADGTASPSSCTNPTVSIVFSPMYSAYIPGSARTFQIPAITSDGKQATWSLSDQTAAQFQPQTFDGAPGILITVLGTGPITVMATESDGACGTSTLSITAATDDDWQIGNMRYNNGVALHLGPPPGFDGGFPEGGGPGPPRNDGGSFFEQEGGTACTNCHGETATGGVFNDVSHTPEQTGGFSDDDLIQIITQGQIPDGGYFDPTVLLPSCDGSAACTAQAYDLWHMIHRWSDISSDQYKGIVVYLRSLTPNPQKGKFNFGGLGPPPDGGFPPPPGLGDGG